MMDRRWECGEDVPDKEDDPAGEPFGGKWGIPDDAQMQFLASQESTADDFQPPAACTLPYPAEYKGEFVPQVYPGGAAETVGETPTEYPEEWSEEQETYCPILIKESAYVPQTLPENFCPITEPECPEEIPYAPLEQDSSVPTVGLFRAPSTEIEDAIIVSSEAKKYGFARALGISLKAQIPYFIVNTYGPVRRLWIDPSKIPDQVAGGSDEAIWIREYSVDIGGASPLNPQKIPFFPLYQITPRKRGKSTKRALANLLNTVKYAAGLVYIATDDTPEGEVQAWHIWAFVAQYEQQEKIPGELTKKLRRLRCSEITEKAIKKAMKKAAGLNDSLRAEGIAREVLRRLVSRSTELVLNNLIGLGRSLPQSTLDATATHPNLTIIEAALLSVLAEAEHEKFQIIPEPLAQVELDLQLENKQSLSMQALVGDDVEDYRHLDGKKVSLRLKKSSRQTKEEPPGLANGLQACYEASRLLDIPISSHAFDILMELYGYGAISLPNTIKDGLSASGRMYITELLEEDRLPVPKNNSTKATAAGGIFPTVNNVAALISELPESARQLLFQDPRRYRALLDMFNLIKKRAEAALLPAALLRPVEVKIEKDQFALQGRGNLLTKEGFLAAWKNGPLYSKLLEELGIEPALEGLASESTALVKNALARKVSDIGRPMTIQELMGLIINVNIGSPKDICMAIASGAAGKRKIGIKNNEYFYDPVFLAHRRLPGGSLAGITSLGLFVASLLGDLFAPSSDFPGLMSVKFAERAESELQKIQGITKAPDRKAHIQKVLSGYWDYLQRRLVYARRVAKEISQNYRRRGARVHWLDVRRPPIAFPGSSTDVPVEIVEALNSIGDGEYQITDSGFLIRKNEENNSIDLVWASQRKLYYRTYHFYTMDDQLAGIEYPAVWVMTYWTSFDVSDIFETYARTRHISVPERMNLSEAWGLFLNLNWDHFDIMPSDCFPAYKVATAPEAIYSKFF